MATIEEDTQGLKTEIVSNSSFFTKKELETIDKLRNYSIKLNNYFVEREEEIEGMFISLISRMHSLFIGTAGTAKSYLIESFCKGIKDFIFFQWQLTKFTTPDQIFGEFNIVELVKNSKLLRIIKDKLPTCHIAYLDEVFNANSAILNSLNSSMNERKFEKNDIPLESLYGASNLIPEEKELQALFDRFLFRFIVKEIQSSENFKKMLISLSFEEEEEKDKVTLEEIKKLQKKLELVQISNKVLDKLIDLKVALLTKENIEPSSRRWKWALKALKGKAILEGRNIVIEEDLFILKNILWNDPKEIPVVDALIIQIVDPKVAKIRELFNFVVDIQKQIAPLEPQKKKEDWDHIMELTKKLQEINSEINGIIKNDDINPKIKSIGKKIADKVIEIKNSIVKDKLGLS